MIISIESSSNIINENILILSKLSGTKCQPVEGIVKMYKKYLGWPTFYSFPHGIRASVWNPHLVKILPCLKF